MLVYRKGLLILLCLRFNLPKIRLKEGFHAKKEKFKCKERKENRLELCALCVFFSLRSLRETFSSFTIMLTF